MLNKIFLLGVGVTNAKKDDVLEYVIKNLEKKQKKFYIVTPNPEILVLADKKKSFKEVLNRADLALNDGVGLKIAARFEGKTLSDRFTGVDFVENVCNAVAKRPITVGFLGGRPGIAEMTAECLLRENPELKIVFTGSEWNPKKILGYQDIKILRKERKNNSHNIPISKYPSIDVLFVAFGFPKQEEWMAEHLNDNIYRVAVGVGGAFDYISGKVLRAPKLFRSIGLEWLFRLIVQPWRIKRQLALFEFIRLVLKEEFS